MAESERLFRSKSLNSCRIVIFLGILGRGGIHPNYMYPFWMILAIIDDRYIYIPKFGMIMICIPFLDDRFKSVWLYQGWLSLGMILAIIYSPNCTFCSRDDYSFGVSHTNDSLLRWWDFFTINSWWDWDRPKSQGFFPKSTGNNGKATQLGKFCSLGFLGSTNEHTGRICKDCFNCKMPLGSSMVMAMYGLNMVYTYNNLKTLEQWTKLRFFFGGYIGEYTTWL